MITRNRAAVLDNPFQRDFKKVLCVCSAGCLRSPTAAVVLAAEPFNFNTRAVGLTTEYAITPIEIGVIAWADEIVVMDFFQADEVKNIMDDSGLSIDHNTPKIINLNIPDIYDYRNPELMELIAERYKMYSQSE